MALGEDGDPETIRKPPRRTPEPLTRHFLAACFRRAAEAGPCASFVGHVVEDVAGRMGRDIEHERRRVVEAKDLARRYEAALGALVLPGATHWEQQLAAAKHLKGVT